MLNQIHVFSLIKEPDSASIFTAEVWAIIKALEQIKDSTASKYTVFTDSLSCLQALQHTKLEHPMIGMMIRKCVFFNFVKRDIIFCWVPSHKGIRGNEKADSAAKSALDLPRTNTVFANIFFQLDKMIEILRSHLSVSTVGIY